jgi:hypothetical protein
MTRLQQLSRPVAIAMWDFSWLLRHHRTGEFEDWDQVLSGLCTRGYNAVRIDAFPHLTAEPVAGTPAPEEYLCRKEFRGADTWGNRYSTRIRPRAALIKFLGRCRAHGIAVGLSTWWLGHGIERQDPLAEVYGREALAGGPLYEDQRVEGNRIRLFFRNVGGGLALKHGEQVQTLVIAGKDLCFRPAQSALDGRTLLVWHDQIEAPVAVRYAWADNPAAANLMNTEGEPAAPFCTQGEIHT